MLKPYLGQADVSLYVSNSHMHMNNLRCIFLSMGSVLNWGAFNHALELQLQTLTVMLQDGSCHTIERGQP